MLLVVQRIRGAGALARLGSSVNVSKTWERKLIWWTSSKPSSVMTFVFEAPLMPALLHRISRGLSVSSHRFPRACTLATLDMSTSHHSITASRCPQFLAMTFSSPTTESGEGSRGGGLLRHPSTRLAPQDANRRAASRPIPLLPPVMRIHFPVKSASGTSIFVLLQQRSD